MTAVEVVPDFDSQVDSILPTTFIIQENPHGQLPIRESWLRSRLQIGGNFTLTLALSRQGRGGQILPPLAGGS